MEKIERAAGMVGLDFYSPRLTNLCPPDAPMEEKEKAFHNNINELEHDRCDFILARIDDFDAGTMWEMGYAYCAAQPVYAFTTVAGRGLNLMLAQSCDGFLQELPSVFKFLQEVASKHDFSEAKKWQASII